MFAKIPLLGLLLIVAQQRCQLFSIAFIHRSSSAFSSVILCNRQPLHLRTPSSSSLSSSSIDDTSTTATIITSSANKVEIEYCTGCRWLLRSSWLAQELLTTFEKDIDELSLRPNNNRSGTFLIRVNGAIVWDRKSNETVGFPELKRLKQIVRDIVSPCRTLGHSDNSDGGGAKTITAAAGAVVIEVTGDDL
jgi:selenoprotein W-related protein